MTRPDEKAHPWRADPDLRTRFPTEHPDDLQVLVHDGEPRRTQRVPEGCWVRVDSIVGSLRSPCSRDGATAPPTSGSVDWSERVVYSGTLLNQPKQLARAVGDRVSFVHAPGMPLPVVVTDEYRRERPSWAVLPCNKCGADQALDPPTTMARTRFPKAPAGSVPISFTAFCPCGGIMVLSILEDVPGDPGADETPEPKPWWRFW